MKFNNLIKTILLEAEQQKPVDWEALRKKVMSLDKNHTFDLNGNEIEDIKNYGIESGYQKAIKLGKPFVNINHNGNMFFYNGNRSLPEHNPPEYGNNSYQMHRLDGPAQIYDNKPSYYINNKHYTKEEFDKYIQKFGGAENTETALDLLNI